MKVLKAELNKGLIQSKVAPAIASQNKDKYDVDSYTVCLLAMDMEDVNR